MNRRSSIKLLSLSLAGFSLRPARNAIFKAFGGTPPKAPVKIFLHGFFFIDVQDQKLGLVVAAPFHPNHHFVFRSDGETQFVDIPMSVIDFQENLKSSSTSLAWPKSILNFEKAKVGLDRQVITRVWSNTLGCLLLLPWPDRIVAHRNGGKLAEFKLGGNVGKVIQNSCNPALSLSISLEYDDSTGLPFRKRHYYAEHCDVPNDDEIADMLRVAKQAFGPKFASKFDLQMTHIPGTPATVTSDPDEQTLGELSGISNNPCPPLPADQKDAQQKLMEGLTEAQKEQFFMIRTANCPMFGMT
ncbi:MAG TPA: hypothetical protein VGK21_17680 [Candidatus Angelobacter sp.]|jgi:hypothetical protein